MIPIFLLPFLQQVGTDRLTHLKKKLGFITLLSSVVLLGIAMYRYYVLGYVNAFSFESFRSFEGFSSIHYVYYSMYFACGSLILLDSLFDTFHQKKYSLWVIFSLFIYSLGIITLVASKTGMVAFIIASMLLAYHKTKNKKYFVVFLGLTLLAVASFLYFNETTRSRFTGLAENLAILKKDELIEPIEFNDLNVRLVFWKISLTHLVKENLFLVGVGTGDAQDYINSLYNLPIYQMYGYVGWDSHNQWVFSFIQLGLPGILLMGFLYLRYFKEAIFAKNSGLLIFLIITFLFSITESILESNKGIIFFVLFFTIFSIPINKNQRLM
ncbi:MAG: O-antigen ligase family protein [Bacteroidetes bacterium]|nr:O-antigen ligase family protein [Bacteroidota bacterium]